MARKHRKKRKNIKSMASMKLLDTVKMKWNADELTFCAILDRPSILPIAITVATTASIGGRCRGKYDGMGNKAG